MKDLHLTKGLLLMAAPAILLSLAGCPKGGGSNGGDVSGTLATVNGEAIPLGDYYSYLMRKPTVQVAVRSLPPQYIQAALQTGQPMDAPVAGSVGFQALRDMINRQLLLQVAKSEGALPTDAEVSAELDLKTKQRPEFVRLLTSQGMTIQDIRRDLTLDLAREKLVTKGVTVTPADADAYIKQNQAQFTDPAQAKLQFIQVSDPAAEKQVDQELASGKTFGVVAANYSKAPNARTTNGAFPVTDVQNMPPRLQELVNKTPEGKATSWQKDGNAYFKFYIQQKVAAKPQAIDAAKREEVRRALALQKGNQSSDLGKKMQDALKNAKIDVQLPALKDAWATAYKNLQTEAPAATGTAPAPATTAATAGAPAPGANKP